MAESPPSITPEAPAAVETPDSVPSKVHSPTSAAPGTAGDIKPPPVKPEPLFYIHVVRWQGETLSFIAQWYTASWQNWRKIQEANPGIDPRRIEPGERILIPRSLLREHKAMPFDFLPPRPAAPPDTTSKRRPPSPDMELFGPREASAAPPAIPEEMELFEPEEIAGRSATTPAEAELFGPLE